MAGEELSPVLFTELLAALPAGGRILDCGCGAGTFDYAAFPHLRIDALDEFVAPAAPFPAHVRYQQARAEALPYPDAAFDLVIANFVMEHVADFPAALREVARVVRAGGHFYMAVPNARSFEDALYRGLYRGGGHLQRHTFESLIAAVYRATPLKLTAYAEWPAGFTFLQDREGLRALVAIISDACEEALGVDISTGSNYLFVFRRERGIGWRSIARVCGYCGHPASAEGTGDGAWRCPACGKVNGEHAPGGASDDRLDADMEALWDRHPHLRPDRLDAIPMPVSPPTPVAAPPCAPDRSLRARLRLAVRILRHGPPWTDG